MGIKWKISFSVIKIMNMIFKSKGKIHQNPPCPF